MATAKNDVVTKEYADTNFVPSEGGTFTGQLTVKYNDPNAPRFVVSNGSFHSFWVPGGHAAHCRGRMYVNSYAEDGGGQIGDANRELFYKMKTNAEHFFSGMLAGGAPCQLRCQRLTATTDSLYHHALLNIL